MTEPHAALRLGGPWLAIAQAIQNGATDIPAIKRQMLPARRKGTGRNVNQMVAHGLLIETDMHFALSQKCLDEMG